MKVAVKKLKTPPSKIHTHTHTLQKCARKVSHKTGIKGKNCSGLTLSKPVRICLTMSPIHEGITIGLKIAQLHRHARKVKKHLVMEKKVTVTAVIDAIIDKLTDLERDLPDTTNSDAEDGSTDRYIYSTQNRLIDQLLRRCQH